MPNVFQQNTATLGGLWSQMQADKTNALTNIKQVQDITLQDRKATMQRMFVMGRSLDNVRDENSYENWKNFMKDTFGQEVLQTIPQRYDPDYIDRKKAEANIMYQTLGEGKPLTVSMYNPETEQQAKVEWGSPQQKRMLQKGWEQMEIVQQPSRGKTIGEELELYEGKKKLDVQYGEGMGGFKGSAEERQYWRETGGKISQSEWEIRNKVKEDKARNRLSDRDQERYDRYDNMAFKTEQEVTKLRSELSSYPKRKDESAFVQSKRDLLTEFEEEAAYYRKKAEDIIEEYGIKTEQKETKQALPKGITQEILDYYKKNYDMDSEEVIRRYKEKNKKNPELSY